MKCYAMSNAQHKPTTFRRVIRTSGAVLLAGLGATTAITGIYRMLTGKNWQGIETLAQKGAENPRLAGGLSTLIGLVGARRVQENFGNFPRPRPGSAGGLAD
jgi:hypothetical protein